jgi:hypothetical protein
MFNLYSIGLILVQEPVFSLLQGVNTNQTDNMYRIWLISSFNNVDSGNELLYISFAFLLYSDYYYRDRNI